MLTKLKAALLGSVLALGIIPGASAATRWDTTSTGWEIDAYDNSSCAAYRPYENGIHVMIGWRRNNDGTNNGGFRFTLIRNSWVDTIKENKTYTLRAVTDGKWWPAMEFTGTKTKTTGGLLSPMVDMEFVGALAQANVVHFYQGDKLILGLQLDGSQEAILKTLACQQAQDKLTQPGNNSSSRQATPPPSVANTDGPWTVPIGRNGTVITLKARLNDGAPMTFMLDTGATVVSIPQDMADRMNLKPIRYENVHYGDGSVGKEGIVVLSRVALVCHDGGTVYLSNVEAMVGKTGAPMLIGKNFLDKFSSYQIDNRSAQLILKQ